jgi:hypothetical protein
MDKGPDGRPGRQGQLELATGLEGRGRRPDEVGIEPGCQDRRGNRVRPCGIGHRDQLDFSPH